MTRELPGAGSAPAARQEGGMPARQRRLAIIVLSVCVVVMAAGTIGVDLLVGMPIDWFWLVSGIVLVGILLALFLWVRLSE
jgi:hypothetical protein